MAFEIALAFAFVITVEAASYPQHMIPSMAYTLSNPAKGYEGKSQQFTSSEFFEVSLTTI